MAWIAVVLALGQPLNAQDNPGQSQPTNKGAHLILAFGTGGHNYAAAITSIPMLSMAQCEEQAALVMSSERMKYKHSLAFECVESR